MPFVTEELYQRINAAFDVTCSSISIEAYPTPNEWRSWRQPRIDAAMQTCQVAIDAARSTKVLYSMSRRNLPEMILEANSHEIEQSLRDNSSLIEALVPCGKVSVISAKAGNQQGFDLSKWSKQILPDLDLYLQLEGQVDVHREEERLSKRLAKLEATRVKLQTKLDKSERPEDRSKMLTVLEEIQTLTCQLELVQSLRL